MNSQPHFPALGMEEQQFREAAHKMIDVIIDYHKTLATGERPVLPDVSPGNFLKTNKNIYDSRMQFFEPDFLVTKMGPHCFVINLTD